MFVSRKPFQLHVMFVSNPGAYPSVEQLVLRLGRLLPFSRTLEQKKVLPGTSTLAYYKHN
jgi:hypothetical protein